RPPPPPPPTLLLALPLGRAADPLLLRLRRPPPDVDAPVRAPPVPGLLGPGGADRAMAHPPEGRGRRGGRRARAPRGAVRELVLHLLDRAGRHIGWARQSGRGRQRAPRVTIRVGIA